MKEVVEIAGDEYSSEDVNAIIYIKFIPYYYRSYASLVMYPDDSQKRMVVPVYYHEYCDQYVNIEMGLKGKPEKGRISLYKDKFGQTLFKRVGAPKDKIGMIKSALDSYLSYSASSGKWSEGGITNFGDMFEYSSSTYRTLVPWVQPAPNNNGSLPVYPRI